MYNLRGITAAVVTPMDLRGGFDAAAADRVLDHILTGPVDGFLVLGMAGEALALDRAFRRTVVDHMAGRLAGRLPLIVGVMGESIEIVLRNIETYAAGRADYVLTTPPGTARLSQGECEHFFRSVADRSPVPLILYNCLANQNHVDASTAARLADHPNIAGLKDTSDLANLTRLVTAVGRREDFILFSGHEYLFLAALALGMDAFVTGGPGNMFPALMRQVMEAWGCDEQAQAVKRFLNLFGFMDEIYSLPCGALAAVKGVMENLGLCRRYMASPSCSASEDEMTRIRQAMAQSGLFTTK